MMKVDQSGVNRISRPETEGTQPLDKNARPNEIAGTEALGGKDKATLSERAKLLAKARVEMSETPEVRTDKVDALREQIKTGNYQIPQEEIVKRLLNRVRMGQA